MDIEKDKIEDIAKVLLAYEMSKDTFSYETPEERQEMLLQYLEENTSNKFLRQPFLMMEDTAFGKKEKYYEITSTWIGYQGEVQGWLLLALVDTIGEMSKMIFECYHTLLELFRKWLRDYLKEENNLDILGALAILKACHLEIIHPEHYASIALLVLKDERKNSGLQEDLIDQFKGFALDYWNNVSAIWGNFYRGDL